MIAAEQLSKRYGEHVAVDELGFVIQGGETFGLLGPNGAGKTTTIGMLVGLLKPDSGTVQVGIQPGPVGAPTDPLVRRRIGIAPQSLSLYDELTGAENLEFFGRLYGLRGSELAQRVDSCLELAGLEDRSKDRVSAYSGGMKRRLNLAAALIHQPDVLLLDEPTVGVDPQSRNHIFECIERLNGEGLTLIYTTHYMEEAQRLCDRVAIVDRGRLLALDTVAGLIDQYGTAPVVTAEVRQTGEGDLPGQLDGNQLRFESTDPVAEIARLQQQGFSFQTLNIARPDLESVFLHLTGRSLRDA